MNPTHTANPPLPIWLLGNPVEHSLSPTFQNAGLMHHSLNMHYSARHTETQELPELVAAIRRGEVLGANITLPHKEAVSSLVDRLSPAALRAGAVNTLVNVGGSIEGHNTDVIGLRRVLVEEGLRTEPPPVATILGAGGATRGVVVALSQIGTRQIVVVNRSLKRAQRLIDSLSDRVDAQLSAMSLQNAFNAPKDDLWRQSAALVHATSLGVGAEEGDASHKDAAEVWQALPWGQLAQLRFVYDICYARTIPPFLHVAHAHGFAGHDGLKMLLYQGTEAFTMWTGHRAPEHVMWSALCGAVGREAGA